MIPALRALMAAPALVLAAAAATTAQPATWQIDPVHSTATFAVRHMMVTTVRGTFQKLAGTVQFDGKDIKTLAAQATIDVASIDTREPKRDEHLRSADFFDAARFPAITFVSKRVEPKDAGRFALVGDLTIKGVTREVTLEVEGPTPEVKDPGGNIRIGASATTRINRQDFGVSWNRTLDAGGVVVGDEVAITLDLSLIRKAPASTR
jgi:polyisoprenoid-binding protein YceI